jgi:hypothetical protein
MIPLLVLVLAMLVSSCCCWLSGHSCEHELETARINGVLGNIDANTGELLQPCCTGHATASAAFVAAVCLLLHLLHLLVAARLVGVQGNAMMLLLVVVVVVVCVVVPLVPQVMLKPAGTPTSSSPTRGRPPC